jgi:hypothetical protein
VYFGERKRVSKESPMENSKRKHPFMGNQMAVFT